VDVSTGLPVECEGVGAEDEDGGAEGDCTVPLTGAVPVGAVGAVAMSFPSFPDTS
jgi:hypothetical protein